MVNNWDWEDDWVFNDDRFQLRNGSDETFLNFLAETVHPIDRDDPDAAAAMVAATMTPSAEMGMSSSRQTVSEIASSMAGVRFPRITPQPSQRSPRRPTSPSTLC